MARNEGNVSFITPNKYLSASYAKSLRAEMPKICRIDRLTDVSHLPIFESASVYPVITSLFKSYSLDKYQIHLFLPKTRQSQFNTDEYDDLAQGSDNLSLLPENLWGFLLSPNMPILQKMITGCISLNEVSNVRATTTAAEADLLGSKLEESPFNGWRVVNTGTIDPFVNFWGERALRHQGVTYDEPILPKNLTEISDDRRQLYDTPKIIIAKMALKFEAFVDDEGEYAALNCNCISSPKDGWSLYSLASILHSSCISFVYKQFFDGLRMSGGYLPFQAPQLKIIPMPDTHQENKCLLDKLGTLRAYLAFTDADKLLGLNQFVIDLIDACVMECYFYSHMKERDLLLNNDTAKLIQNYNSESNEQEHVKFLQKFYRTANAPNHPIRNRLLRLTADSPDLLAVIKQEGRV